MSQPPEQGLEKTGPHPIPAFIDLMTGTAGAPQGSQPYVSVVAQTSFTGPLPPPSALQGFEDVVPGAAERLIAMAEQEGQHRREMEKKEQTAQIESERRGMWMALGVVMAALAVVGILGAFHEGSAAATFGVAIAGLAAVFVLGRKLGIEKKNADAEDDASSDGK